MRITTPAVLRAACAALLLLDLTGCMQSQKQSPSMGYADVGIQTNFDRDDLIVMETVTGTSTSEQRFVIIQIIDGDKFKVLGIPFFKEKYSYVIPAASFFVSTEDRAYYNALENAPDADFILERGLERETEGIPFIWDRTTVTYRGKAMRFKADK